MNAPLVQLEFSGARARTPVAGVVLLLAGLTCVAAAIAQYRSIADRRAGLELKLAASLRHAAKEPIAGARTARMKEDAGKVALELATPWTVVLSDLEAASQDSAGVISVLSVEPDPDKHRVRVNAESKDLSGALAYLGRLQTSHSLRYPMLDSHEVVADDKDHPVRFAMTAEWRESP